MYDRYRAGGHREVWTELVALGEGVRGDPHPPVAVAYETMRRAGANVRTLVQRLSSMNYVFTPDGPPGGMPQLSGMFGMLAKARDKVLGQTSIPVGWAAPCELPDSRADARRGVPSRRQRRKRVKTVDHGGNSRGSIRDAHPLGST